jgi:hypothetical protein
VCVYRDGKRVSAQGKDAFVLSRADAKNSARKDNCDDKKQISTNKRQKVQRHEVSALQKPAVITKSSILAYTTICKNT